MCKKYIDYVALPNGTTQVVEHTSSCTPGFTCSRPRIIERNRPMAVPYAHVLPISPRTGSPSSSSAARRAGSPYAEIHLNLPPSPRKTPSPSRGGYASGSDSSARRRSRRHESTILVGEDAAATLLEVQGDRRRRPNTSSRRDAPPSPRVVVEAPEPPSPLRGRSLRRSSTMPTQKPEYVFIEDKNAHRRSARRPVTAETLAGLGIGVVDPVGIPQRPSRRQRSPGPGLAPAAVIVEEDRAARRLRRAAERRASTGPGLFTSASDMTRSASAAAAAAAAAAEVHKELRWQDQVKDPLADEIAKQNERIARRPKAALHQEVRGILKNPLATPPPATATGTFSSAIPNVVITPSATDRERERASYDEIRRALGREDVPRRYEVAMSRALREERRRAAREQAEEDEMLDRLRDRFDSGGDRRDRRSRVYYPGEGLYKYL